MDSDSKIRRDRRRLNTKDEGATKLTPIAITAIVTVLQTCVIAFFGFALTGKVELALKERQGTVSAASAMEKIVTEMQDEKENKIYEMQARKLAMYGVDAIRPLILMAATDGPYGEDVPIHGLLLIAVQNRRETCQALAVALKEESLINKRRLPGIKSSFETLKCERDKKEQHLFHGMFGD